MLRQAALDTTIASRLRPLILQRSLSACLAFHHHRLSLVMPDAHSDTVGEGTKIPPRAAAT